MTSLKRTTRTHVHGRAQVKDKYKVIHKFNIAKK